jgi:hypothetical protein
LLSALRGYAYSKYLDKEQVVNIARNLLGKICSPRTTQAEINWEIKLTWMRKGQILLFVLAMVRMENMMEGRASLMLDTKEPIASSLIVTHFATSHQPRLSVTLVTCLGIFKRW